MFVVDTNILVYAANCDAPEHAKCRSLLQAWREQPSPWYLTWGIVYEFLRVATHPKVFRSPFSPADAWAFVEAVLAAPSVKMLVETERHPRVASDVFAEIPHISGNLVFDAHTDVLMREHGRNRSQGGGKGDRSMFSGRVEAYVDVNWPKNGPVPGRPVNGYTRTQNDLRARHGFQSFRVP